MKRRMLTILIVLSMIAINLTSCLGDGNGTKIEAVNEIAYIKYEGEYLKSQYAIVLSGMNFTADYVKSLNEDRFYDLDYKISSGNTISGTNVYLADYVASTTGYPYPYGKFSEIANIAKEELEIASLGISLFSAYDMLNDNWAFYYSCKAYEIDGAVDDAGNNNLRLVATLDPTKQFKPSQEEIGEPLDANQAIITLHVERIQNLVGTGTKPEEKIITGKAAINLSKVRDHFMQRMPSSIAEAALPAAILFQYEVKKDDGTVEVKTVGDGSLNPSERRHWMAVGKVD